MRYVILIHEPAAGFAARTDPALSEGYWSGTLDYLRRLKDAGIFAGGAGLVPPEQGFTLRYAEDQAVVQDGPFADTKEQLGGFFIVDVPDAGTAQAWAMRFPRRPGLVVEVRPALPSD